jgi:hypothetical protein
MNVSTAPWARAWQVANEHLHISSYFSMVILALINHYLACIFLKTQHSLVVAALVNLQRS